MTRSAPHRIAVVTGDHRLPDPTKRGGRYHAEDELTHKAMIEALQSLEGYDFAFLSEHAGLLERLRQDPPDLVVNFCDTGFRNLPALELNLPAYLEMLDIPYTDCTSGYRCYRSEVIEAVDAFSIRASGYSLLEEMVWRVHKHGFRIEEIPIVFEDRTRGDSKIDSSEIWRAAWHVLVTAIRGRR